MCKQKQQASYKDHLLLIQCYYRWKPNLTLTKLYLYWISSSISSKLFSLLEVQ
jgi:hypothetical protein